MGKHEHALALSGTLVMNYDEWLTYSVWMRRLDVLNGLWSGKQDEQIIEIIDEATVIQGAPMSYEQPTSAEEYRKKFDDNQHMSGQFLETTMHMPCPFCAAPEFWVFKILEIERVLGADMKCNECHRGARALFKRDRGGVSFEIVQVSGSAQPEWLEPKMRWFGIDAASGPDWTATQEVFRRDDCTFQYCPRPDQCKESCAHPRYAHS
jgi:hypothetical protein